MTKERIEKLLKAGANVVLTTKGIDDMALKVCCYFSLVLFLTIFLFKYGDLITIFHAVFLYSIGCLAFFLFLCYIDHSS